MVEHNIVDIYKCMKPYGIIYKITNLITKKVYIGLSTKTLKKRWKEHVATSKTDYNHPFYNSIRFYKIENFKEEQICECFSKKELGEKEQEYIQLYNSIDRKFGYNIKPGGYNNIIVVNQIDGNISNISKEFHKNNPGANVGEKNSNSILTWKDVEDIRQNLDDLSNKELADKYKISKITITKIKSNKLWIVNDIDKYKKEDNAVRSMHRKGRAKINWHIVLEIRENKGNLSTSELAKKYNLDNRTICGIYTNNIWKLEDYPSDIRELAQNLKNNRILDKRSNYNISEDKLICGEKSPNAKFTWDDAYYIRENPDNLLYKQLAEKFNVSLGCINRIKANLRWKKEYYPQHIKDFIELKQKSI